VTGLRAIYLDLPLDEFLTIFDDTVREGRDSYYHAYSDIS
jgi:hypothetical protein